MAAAFQTSLFNHRCAIEVYLHLYDNPLQNESDEAQLNTGKPLSLFFASLFPFRQVRAMIQAFKEMSRNITYNDGILEWHESQSFLNKTQDQNRKRALQGKTLSIE